MPARFSDDEISELLAEPKQAPAWPLNRELKQKRGHREREFEVEGARGNRFRVMIRQATANVLDFSVILVVLPEGTNQVVRLRRYNGKGHEHRNRIEGDRFYQFHIHTATERYQELGMDEESFAEPTDRFWDLASALECLKKDCSFIVPSGEQPSLFEGGN